MNEGMSLPQTNESIETTNFKIKSGKPEFSGDFLGEILIEKNGSVALHLCGVGGARRSREGSGHVLVKDVSYMAWRKISELLKGKTTREEIISSLAGSSFLSRE